MKRTFQPPAGGPRIVPGTAAKSAAANLARPLAPAAPCRRLAAQGAPASARCWAPHQHCRGLRPALPQAQHSAALRALQGLAPLQWPLPRGPRSCGSLRLAGLESSEPTSVLAARPGACLLSWCAPRIRLRFPLRGSPLGRSRLHSIPPQAHTIPPLPPPAALVPGAVSVATFAGPAPPPGPHCRPG